MQDNRKDEKKPRIAWGGDRYFLSDGLPTEYFINLQKEKVMREKKGGAGGGCLTCRKERFLFQAIPSRRSEAEL